MHHDTSDCTSRTPLVNFDLQLDADLADRLAQAGTGSSPCRPRDHSIGSQAGDPLWYCAVMHLQHEQAAIMHRHCGGA